MTDGTELTTTVDAPPAPIWRRGRYPWWVRLVNVAGRLGRPPRLGPEALMAAATARTGLSDFGDDRFREGLGRLIEAFGRQPNTHALGRLAFKGLIIKLLVGRLRIQEELKRHPETLDVPVPRPLVVIGLPRSGTTFLHRLLSQDRKCRPLLYWESLSPAPAPRPETYETDPRIAEAGRDLAMLYRLAPGLRAGHFVGPTEPEEGNEFFIREFEASILGLTFDVPEYLEWLKDRDRTPGYQSMKRQLQILSRHVRGDYWALKAPAHIFALDALWSVFPDARVVQAHRDPKSVLPSLCNLAANLRTVTADRVDVRKLGTELQEWLAYGAERAIEAREGVGPSLAFDVRYDELVAAPVETARAIHRHFGIDPAPDFEDRARRYLAENPRHKHGAHRYALEDFGLDADSIDRRFERANAWVADRFNGHG